MRANIFVAVTATIGAALLWDALRHLHPNNPAQFCTYLLVALLASTMKVRLPGMESTMSVHFLLVLLCTLELSLAETLLVGCAAALMQCFWKTTRRPEAVKVVFNVLSMSPAAIWMSYFTYHGLADYLQNRAPFFLILAASVYFLGNTVPVSVVIALCERRSIRKIWSETYFWSFPYYLVGAAVVGFVNLSDRTLGWQTGLLTVPVMYGIYRSYQLYLGRLDGEKKRVEIEAQRVEAERQHVEEVCALHLRTIEGLALAIDAKDHTTHEHLHRVRTYAIEIARALGLNEQEMDALRAAALLHDIGKLGVPDHIINKPGRLSEEEFEKMKIHPIVGAEILEKIAFPYPVAPIVRAHHEKWNGKGYPYGSREKRFP